jgi:hypothetical protein
VPKVQTVARVFVWIIEKIASSINREKAYACLRGFFSGPIDLAGASVFGFRTGSAGLYAEIRLKEKGHT